MHPLNRISLAVTVAMSLASSAGLAAPQSSTIELQPLASYVGSGAGSGLTGIEIPAYDPGTRRVFAVNAGNNTVDVIDLSNPPPASRCSILRRTAGALTVSPFMAVWSLSPPRPPAGAEVNIGNESGAQAGDKGVR